MSTRSVKVVLEAEVARYLQNVGKAEKATEAAGKAAEAAGRKIDQAAEGNTKAADKVAGGNKKQAQSSEEASKSSDKSSESSTKDADSKARQAAAAEKAGTAMLAFGAVSLAGLGASAKAAMDWESAWAGVTKTVDGTPEQMDQLEASLRGLAKTLPATHEEIAGVAEAAGQLGVAREDVVGFTKTMIDLSETTNLTADEAATSIAQISNVMGTMARDGAVGVERFGATLVALGNAGASTEKEILEMSKRIAGAGKLIGASESDVLALANAMASVGIEAQLGGGVMSRVMQRMYADVMDGGASLQNLADVSGVSAKEFATAFETDPVRAVDMMVKGLGRVKDEGGNVVQTMSELGIKGTEETGVILRLAGAGDLLSESLKLGDSAWASNSALAAEAAKRYETTESKVKVAWNNIKDAAIDAGAVLLPVIQGVAESVAGLAQAFGNLPAPVQGVVTVLAAVTGGAVLLGGAALTLVPKILDTVGAFKSLSTSSAPAAKGLVAVGKAAGGALALGAVTTILAKLAEADYMADIDQGMGKVADVLADVAAKSPGAAAGLDTLFKDIDGGSLINGVDDLGTALQRTFHPNRDQEFNDWAENIIHGATGVKGSSQILADSFDRIDQGMADMLASGNTEGAAASFERINQMAKDRGISVDELATKFPKYADAIKAASAEEKTAEGTGKAAAETIKDVGTAAEQSAKQAEDLVTSLLAMNNVNLSAADAQLGFDKAIHDAGENAVNAGAGVDYLNEATGAYNETAAKNLEVLNGIASQGSQVAQTVYDQTGSYDEFRKSLESSRQSLFDVAKAYYPTEAAAWAYVDSVLAIPPEMKTDVNITDNNTIQGVRDNLKLLHDAIQGTPDKTVTVTEPMSPEVIKGLENLGYVVTHLPNGTIQVSEQGTDATGRKIDNTAGKKRLATIDSQAITSAAENALNYTARDRTSNILTTSTTLNKYINEGAPAPWKGAPFRAAGGDLDMAPGPKGVDSQLFYGAKGEHVFTAQEVDLMGGQQAVYQFRSQLRAGIPAYANGGAVGTGASASAGSVSMSAGIDYDRLASAVMTAAQASPIHTTLKLGQREFASAIQESRAFENRR